ncbi:hypothetical protein [Bacillus nakamurai]|nr:hypothetical protein [Bacillus nakamurai]MCC9023590.1 hypothetical protein [Bacillus nakamurai]
MANQYRPPNTRRTTSSTTKNAYPYPVFTRGGGHTGYGGGKPQVIAIDSK